MPQHTIDLIQTCHFRRIMAEVRAMFMFAKESEYGWKYAGASAR